MFRNIKKVVLAAAFAVIAFGGTTALAAQIEGGNFYRVKNVTTGSNYADQVAADKCQTVQFLAQIHNPGPQALTGVRVKATLPTVAADPISSTATVTASNAATQTDTATVDLPTAYKVEYIPGSTKLLDHNAGVIQSLPDGVTGAGVDVPGGVGVSLQQIRYVQFQAKIDCPSPQPEPSVVCDALTAEYIGTTKVPAKIKFTAKATAKDGATINGYIFNFGDGEKADVAEATVEHTYNEAGEYKATVQVKSSLGTTEVSENCAVTIKVTKDQPPVIVPPTETPVTPGSPNVLPSTGPEAAIAGFFGTGALGYSVRQFIASRRRLNSLFE